MVLQLHQLLQRTASRLRSLRLWTCLAICWFACALVGLMVARWGPQFGWTWTWNWAAIAGAGALAAAICLLAVRRTARDPRQVAQRIEAKHPELGALLLAALDLAPTLQTRRLGYLQSCVVRSAIEHGRRRPWTDAIPGPLLRLAQLGGIASLGALAAVCLMLFIGRHADARLDVSAKPDAPMIAGDGRFDVKIEPGDLELERGTTLLVVAKFGGVVPPETQLMTQEIVDAAAPSTTDDELRSLEAELVDDAEAHGLSVRPMSRSFDDPQFVGRVAGVNHDLEYFVAFSGRRTRSYRVRVFEYPRLERSDMRIVFPEYTRLGEKRIEDVRQATAVEGSQVTIVCRLNKDVEAARLVDRDGAEWTLIRLDDAEPVYEVGFTLNESRRFRLHLVDQQGRPNKSPPELVVSATPNRPPTVKIARPARDVRVSPIEELEIAAKLSDDFGLLEYGLSFALGGDEPREIVLGEGDAPQAASEVEATHLIDFESLDAEPDQLVSYFLWAEDYGPDGQPRRTMSDIYFAEVRHFDEIFREGEQPTQQQAREQQQQQGQQGQGAGQQAEQLAELQKQLISATWNVIRRERDRAPTPAFSSDAEALQQSQAAIVEQLETLAQELSDAESLTYAEEARDHMNEALEQLTEATSSTAAAPLRPAMSAEQAAYQSLLRLRAREFNVAQSNQPQQGAPSGGASGAGSRSQRQLQQLELSAEENRYETESRALDSAAEGQDAQREQSRQILDRLRELARRQQDLNDRLRELQSSLEAAQGEEERQRLERELKRLREQQRQLLQDTDELQNDMDTSQNAEQMRDAREQLEQTRQRVQQATESLEEGQVSQALTEGTRASRELEQLRDDFRQRAAEGFADEMRDLRQAARELDERQQDLSQQLAELNETQQQSLRSQSPREEIADGLKEQQVELDELVERLQQTTQEAEEPEPLLARELYDTAQQALDRQIDQSLDVTRQMIDAGVSREAADVMRVADQGIRELREGVDRAAESVIGDETEALRRAEANLRQLAEELNREIQEATGQDRAGASNDSSTEGAEGERQPADQEASEGAETEAGQTDSAQPAGQQPGQGDQQARQASDQPNRESTSSPGQAGESETPSASGQQPGQQQGGAPSQQDQTQSSQPPNQQQQSQAQSGQQRGRGGGGSAAGEPGQQQPSQQQDNAAAGATDQPPQQSEQAAQQQGSGGDPNGRGGPGRGLDEFIRRSQRAGGPITGEDFRGWSDRMRDVEEILDDSQLSSEAARIRDRAEAARADFKRHAQEPDWNKLVEIVADPLTELRERVTEVIRRRERPDALAPIDRDPVPAEFEDRVRIYYERLGSGE